MARQYTPLTVNRGLALQLRNIQTASVQGDAARQALGELLQSALQLEFATIPTYLSAAFSLTANTEIRDLILRVAREEMLHLTAVANLMNAIGIAPNIGAAVPEYPYELNVLEPALKLNLSSFSFDLIETLFMAIEAPEVRVVFPALAAQRPKKTIGEFYAGIIQIITDDTIPDLFKDALDNAYKQRAVDPNFQQVAYVNNQDTSTYPLKCGIDFKITDKGSAVRHLSWVVSEGEGEAPYKPLDTEGLPGHHYRFESILKSHYLVRDDNVALKYSFSGGDLPFDKTGVHEFDINAKAKDYNAYPTVQQQMKFFNDDYTKMINLLQAAFNCPSPQRKDQAAEAYKQAVQIMRSLPHTAGAIVRQAHTSNIKGGVPFEYAGPDIS
jgi:rubrerythrin